ncbi:hypothetical protein [Tessaracoccus sp.]
MGADPAAGNARAVAGNTAVAAREAYFEALDEWRVTPAGQAELERDIATARTAGEEMTAKQAEAMLDIARATRERQIADLRCKERQDARIAAATPEEVAFMTSVDARINEAQQELDANKAQAAAASEALRPARLAHQQAAAEEIATARTARLGADAAFTDLHADLRVYRVEASRLYQEAGARNGRFYAADMVEATLGSGRQEDNYGRPYGVVRPVAAIKTKRTGPDVDACKAALAASATDEPLQSAKAAVKAQYEVLAGRERVWQTAQDAITATSRQKLHDLQSEYQVEQATNAVRVRRDTLVAERADARARVGAGIGVTPTTPARWAVVSERLRQNPDGSLNVWSREGPSNGFPNGRYLRATGVSAMNGGMYGSSNSLVMENGRNVHPSEHVYRNTGGLQTDRSTPRLVTVEPQAGATPVELPANGWGYFADSTD